MPTFKYSIGYFVMPIVHDDWPHEMKMVVTGRVTEEYANHIERYYICSHFRLGDLIRQRFDESEIVAWAEVKK